MKREIPKGPFYLPETIKLTIGHRSSSLIVPVSQSRDMGREDVSLRRWNFKGLCVLIVSQTSRLAE